jgi:hypothetical protein
MVYFNGSVKLKICEAVELRPTDFATRHQMGGSKDVRPIDPYLCVEVDDVHIARTTSKPKTTRPVWNEEFSHEVHNGQQIGFTVFHDAAIPPDEFVANCSLLFEDLKSQSDIWVRILLSCLMCAFCVVLPILRKRRVDRTTMRFDVLNKDDKQSSVPALLLDIIILFSRS